MGRGRDHGGSGVLERAADSNPGNRQSHPVAAGPGGSFRRGGISQLSRKNWLPAPGELVADQAAARRVGWELFPRVSRFPRAPRRSALRALHARGPRSHAHGVPRVYLCPHGADWAAHVCWERVGGVSDQSLSRNRGVLHRRSRARAIQRRLVGGPPRRRPFPRGGADPRIRAAGVGGVRHRAACRDEGAVMERDRLRDSTPGGILLRAVLGLEHRNTGPDRARDRVRLRSSRA